MKSLGWNVWGLLGLWEGEAAGGLDFGEGDAELGALAKGAVKADGAGVGEGDVFDDCKAKAGAAVGASAAFLDAIEALEDAGLVFGGDAGPVVLTANFDAGLGSVDAEADLEPAVGEFGIAEGIGEKIEEDLLDAEAVGFDLVGVGVDLDFDLGILLGDGGLHLVEDLVEDVAEVYDFEFKGDGALFELRDGEEVVNEEAEAAAVFCHRVEGFCEELAVGGAYFLEGFDVALNNRQRCSEFVGDIGDEVFAEFFGAFDLGDVMENDDDAADGGESSSDMEWGAANFKVSGGCGGVCKLEEDGTGSGGRECIADGFVEIGILEGFGDGFAYGVVSKTKKMK